MGNAPMQTRPALYEHCSTVYDAMLERSRTDSVEGEGEVKVYEGFSTKLFRELLLAVPYYTSVMDALQKMDCVRQIRRGGGSSPSVWIVLQPPTAELWDAMQAGTLPASTGTTTKRNRIDMLEQQMRDMRSMLIDLGNQMADLRGRLDG